MSKIYVDEIHPKTSGGVVTNSTQVVAKAYNSGNQNSISADTYTKVALNTSDIDTHSGWDTANYYYTIPYSGNYLISYDLEFDTHATRVVGVLATADDANSTQDNWLSYKINTINSADTGNNTVSSAEAFYLTAGTKLYLFGYSVSSSNAFKGETAGWTRTQMTITGLF